MAMPATIWMSRSMSTTFTLPYPDESHVRLFCVTFRPHDKILLFPPSVQTAKILRSIVEANWGLDSHETAPDCYTLNLTGSPFLKHARRESAIMVKYLCCALLDRLKENGWELIACCDLSCRTDLTAWYFARSAPKSAILQLQLQQQLRPTNIHEENESDSGSGSYSTERRKSSTPALDLAPPSLVCLSLSKTRKLQLINSPVILQRVLRNVVHATYAPGLNSDSQRGKHYEVKLNGTPWETTNRDQLTAACRMLTAIFAEFNTRGYRFFGVVNFKETADSIFFEYDAGTSNRSMTASSSNDQVGQTSGNNERFMMVIMDGISVLRLVGIQRSTVDAVEQAISKYWDAGLASKPFILDEPNLSNKISTISNDDQEARLKYSHHFEGVTVEFTLKGSPWLARLSKISKTRQFMARVLDVLLSEGWTVVTGLDISRGLNSKSALLFESCTPSAGLRHACISPLGKQSLQVLNAPASLRRIIQNQFEKIITAEKTFNDNTGEGFLDAIFEAKLNGFHWDPHPEKDATEYVYTRKHMGALLQRLMDAGWRIVVSADVGHHQEDTDVGEGIHSWFLIFTGNATDSILSPPSSSSSSSSALAQQQSVDRKESLGVPEAAHQLMNVSSRMGRRASAFAATAALDSNRRQSLAPRAAALGSPVSRHQRR